MKINKVNKILSQLRKQLDFLAKEEIKSNEKLKLVLKDSQSHFSKKNSWPLDLEVAMSYSGVSNRYIFNTILEIKGYKIFYDKKSRSVVFKK